MILAGHVPLELRSLDLAAEPLRDEVVGEAPGPVRHVRPRESPITEYKHSSSGRVAAIASWTSARSAERVLTPAAT
jgi:hypothetical protein